MRAVSMLLRCAALVLTVLPLPVVALGGDGFNLELLEDPQAVCLDGTQGGYYLREGSPDIWLIEMEGGGWCTNLQDCASRAKTDIGSNKKWPPSGCPGMDGGSNGMLSNDCAVNPHFCNATAVHANYCDGASFSSASPDTPVVNGVTLHFAGAHIFNATIARLLALGMGAAQESILKGCSAGGLAVYLHCDLFADMMREAGSAARVTCMPDAGYFRYGVNTTAGQPLYTPQEEWVYYAQGVVQMDKGCVAAHAATNDTWQCFFAENNLPYITTPLFVTQDLVDSWQMANVLALGCNPNAAAGAPSACSAAQLADMQAFRQDMLDKFAPLVANPANGGFLSACYQHCHQNIGPVVSGRGCSSLFFSTLFPSGALCLLVTPPHSSSPPPPPAAAVGPGDC